MDCLHIRNWERFQQYKDREPRWIKLYRSLNRNYEWCQLSDKARSQLVGLWLLAAELGNQIPLDEPWIMQQISGKGQLSLNELVTNGFVVVSKNVHDCTDVYSEKSREETEKSRGETEKRRVEGEKRPRFTPPTVAEVEDYRREKNLHRLDPADFVDLYASKGWMVGSNKMKCWKAAACRWDRREGEKKVNPLDTWGP